MSKTPISASSDAAVTWVMPWSCAAGIRCVEMRPFVVAPQTKNVEDSNPKTPDPAAIASPSSAAEAPPGAGGGATQPSGAPKGVVPTSDGRFRISSATGGRTTKTAVAATTAAAQRQSNPETQARIGRNTSE